MTDDILTKEERQFRINAAVTAMLAEDRDSGVVAANMLLSPDDANFTQEQKMQLLMELIHTATWDLVKLTTLVASNMNEEDRSITPSELWAMLIKEGLFTREADS